MEIVPLPTSASPTQIQPIQLVGPNPTDYSPAPALAALHDAYQKGLISASEIQPLFQQGLGTAKDSAVTSADIQAANLRKQVQPVQAQAEIASAKGAAKVAPLEAAAKSGALSGQIEAEPFVNQTALNSAKTASTYSKFDSDVASTDPTGSLANSIQILRSWGLPIPRDASGQPDAKAAGSLATELQSNTKIFSGPIGQKLLDAANSKAGGLGLLFNKDGTFKGIQQATKDVSDAPPALNADQTQAATSAMTQLQATLGNGGILDEAQSLVDMGVVGPGWNQGSKASQVGNKVASFFGYRVPQYDAQDRLSGTLASGIMNQIKSFAGSGAGQIRTAEIAWFQRNQPDIDSTPQRWKTWIDQARAQLTAVYKDRQTQLSSGQQQTITENAPSSTPTPPGAPVPGDRGIPPGSPAPSAASGAAAPTWGTTTTKVTTMEQYNALPYGTPYFDAQGKPKIKTAPPQAQAGPPTVGDIQPLK